MTRGRFHQHFMNSFNMRRFQKCKKDWRLDCIFAVLGSVSVKAGSKMLVKSTPAVPEYFIDLWSGRNLKLKKGTWFEGSPSCMNEQYSQSLISMGGGGGNFFHRTVCNFQSCCFSNGRRLRWNEIVARIVNENFEFIVIINSNEFMLLLLLLTLLGRNSQTFLGKLVRFFLTLRHFYGVVIHRK